MKVLLTHSYFLRRDPKQLKAGSPYSPLATLYAASFLMENAHEVHFADLQFGEPEEIEVHITTSKPQALVIYDDGFNYLNKMCLTNMREAAFKMQEVAKKHQLPVIVSSSDATDNLENYFSKGADYILIGEAENTLLELLNTLSTNGSVGRIQGIAYKENQLIKKNTPRQVVKELDQFPSAAWQLIDFNKYKKVWLANHGFFSINMVTTRGCPYKCNWCAKPIYGNRYNSHSAQRVVNDIKKLQSLAHFDHIWFADDIFGLKPGWLLNFRDEIKKQNITVRYKIQSRADLLDEESVKLLADSGCDEVWLGAESGSQKILDAMDKGTTVQQIKDATRLLKAHGIKACFFLQFGYTGEVLEDIALTVSMVDELQPDDIGISVSYPLPGTKFYDSVKAQMQEKKNWSDSDELLLMFSSTFKPAFYRHLQRYVHYRFRSQQVMRTLKEKKLHAKFAYLPYYLLREKEFKLKLRNLEPATVGL